MEIELPNYGCNYINSSNVVYNINGNTRETYVIYEGSLILQRTDSSNYGYNTTGYNCLNTGDLIYKPETAVTYPLLSMVIIGVALLLMYKIFRGIAR